MIFAAIADIHGNCAALEAVLEDIARLGIKDIVNLGDCFSGPLEAGFTGDVLVGNWIPSVLGNHDRELIERAPEEMGRLGEAGACAADRRASGLAAHPAVQHGVQGCRLLLPRLAAR